MAKQIVYGADAKKAVKEGIDAVANAVKTTLGPCGQNVLIADSYNEGKVTKDGVSVARAIDLKDPILNAGAKLVKKVASKVGEDVGDGTTTATVLAQAIVEKGSQLMGTGVNPIEMKEGIDYAVREVVKYFDEKAIKIDSEESITRVATVSTNGDEVLGKLVGEIINSVGNEGVVTVESSKTTETYTENVKGLRFDRGYVSQYFITDVNKMTAELNNPLILITDQKISTIKSIEKVLTYVAQAGRELLIISDGVEGEALTMLILNKMRGTLKVAAVKCPGFGDRRNKELEDIAAVVGGSFVTTEKAMQLNAINPESVLGCADKVSITSKHCTIIGGKSDEERLNQRIENLRKEISEESGYNKSNLQARLSKLLGGVAVIYAGGNSEVEMNEKKDRIDDALCACRAALEGGILPGGGIAYLKASLHLDELKLQDPMSTSFAAGYNLIKQVLTTPLERIIDNALGEGKGAGVIFMLQDSRYSDNYGYDARNNQYVDMITEGIVDPTNVCKATITNAASIAGMYLTTNCIIVEEPEDKEVNK